MLTLSRRGLSYHELAYQDGAITEEEFRKRVLAEEEEEEIDTSGMSGADCPCCQQTLAMTEEVYLLEVMESVQLHGEIITSPILSVDNDYQYDPLILHLMCWEECIEIIDTEREFQLPYESVDGILLCSVCESTIAPIEPYVSATFGEIRYTGRTPKGESTQSFERLQQPKPVCIACMVYVIEDHLENWEDLLDNLPTGDDEEEEDAS